MGSVVLLAGLLTIAGSEATIVTAAGTGQPGDGADGGLAVETRLNLPFDVALDARGNLYLSDTFNHRVRRVDRATGRIVTVAGNGTAGFSGDGGPATKAQLNEPYGIVVGPGGALCVADRLNRRVRRVDPRQGT